MWHQNSLNFHPSFCLHYIILEHPGPVYLVWFLIHQPRLETVGLDSCSFFTALLQAKIFVRRVQFSSLKFHCSRHIINALRWHFCFRLSPLLKLTHSSVWFPFSHRSKRLEGVFFSFLWLTVHSRTDFSPHNKAHDFSLHSKAQNWFV